MTIKVCIAGATGWTGGEVARRLLTKPGKLELVAAIARKAAGQDVGEALGLPKVGWTISKDLNEAARTKFDVLVDYTKPDSVKARVLDAVERGYRVVVGTSGMTAADYADIERAVQAKGTGVVAAGNFSLMAAMAKLFSLQMQKYAPKYELIDYAIDTKVDAPSGTVRELSEALGGKGAVHSVRLPGYVVGFEALFGAHSERLSIRYDAGSSAEPYVAGTLLAAEKVMEVKGLMRGFDKLLALSLMLLFFLIPMARAADQTAPTWVQRSNAVAEEYTRFFSELYPELGSTFGMKEFDKKGVGIVDDMESRERAGLEVWKDKLAQAVTAEKDPNLKIDLEIMQDMVDRSLEGLAIDEKVGAVPYALASRSIYTNLFMLVNPQSSADRKAAAVDRFKAYVDGFGEYKPYTVAQESRTRAFLKSHAGKPTFWPLKAELEKYLADSPTYVQGVQKMLEQTGRKDWADAFQAYEKQIAAYDAFLKTEVLPKARTDFKLPPEVYAFVLKQKGIDQTPQWLIKTARADFATVYKDFEKLGGVKAIQKLKKKQLAKPKDVEALYKDADLRLQGIIAKAKLVSLPKEPLKIRLADDAESRAFPVPHLTPPPLIDNKGERPEFVVPTSSTGKMPFDDFSYKEAAIVLTAHEGRPGHDLQFSSMLENGMSLVRARYAFNNVNVEGWGLYAEDLVFPHLTKNEQLVALQTRLWRIARTFLDPEIQTGKATLEDVEHVFVKQLGVSPAMAKLEGERYTFEDPGQAPSYYYGLLKLRALRDQVIGKDGKQLQCFNDAVLSAGLLPMDKARALVEAAGCQKASH